MELQGLVVAADRQNQPPSNGELIEERLRDVVGRGGHDDGVEGGFFRPASIAVTDARMDVAVAKFRQCLRSLCRQWLDDFDGEDVGHNLGQDCSLVSGAGSHLKYLLRPL